MVHYLLQQWKIIEFNVLQVTADVCCYKKNTPMLVIVRKTTATRAAAVAFATKAVATTATTYHFEC